MSRSRSGNFFVLLSSTRPENSIVNIAFTRKYIHPANGGRYFLCVSSVSPPTGMGRRRQVPCSRRAVLRMRIEAAIAPNRIAQYNFS